MTKAYLELSDVKRLERAATNVRDRLLIRILFHLGCRVSEALSLEVKDIDFSQGTLTIEHLKARLGKSHAFCPGCGVKVERAMAEEREQRRLRTLPVDNETLEILENYIRRGGQVTRKGKQLIFGINRHRGWQVVGECADRAGLVPESP